MMKLFSLLAFENLKTDPQVILAALDFLWKGLLAIFVVIGLIILAVKLTSFCVAKYDTWQKQRQEKQNQETTQNEQ